MTFRELIPIAAVVLALGAHTRAAADQMSLKGSEAAEIDRNVSYVDLTDRAKVTLKSGAKVAHLQAQRDSEVVVENGAEVSHLTITGRSVARVFGGRISNLSVLGSAQAHLHRLHLEGGGLYSSTFSGSGIIYEAEAQIHFYAEIISVDFGIVRGIWSNGQRFSVGLVEKPDTTRDIYRRPASMPRQLVVHELPGPAFDCRRAATTVERTICADKDLAKLDKELAKLYAQTLAAAADAPTLQRAQRLWLSDRDKCANRACIEAAYRGRIEAINASGEMTNQRAQSICNTVTKAVNDGSIVARFVKFENVAEADANRWQQLHPKSFSDLYQTLKITQKGKTRTLGILGGGGSCASCDIVDIDAKEFALYPADDEEQRLRWAGWGHCDHLMMVDGEPIVVTGSFGHGRSRATLVTWIAPDGAKRALCHLASSGNVNTRITRSDNRDLCRAVTDGQVKSVPWLESVSVEDRGKDRRNRPFDRYQTAEFDIDMDGKKDMIVRYEYASGAGCGSFSQWLKLGVKESKPKRTLRKPDEPERLGIGYPPGGDLLEEEGESGDTYVLVDTSLAKVLEGSMAGPIEGSDAKNGPFSLKIFSFRGRPYFLGRGAETSASVASIWGGKRQTWCEFDLLPQHKVELYYPIETWPVSSGRK